ncbi:glucosaminidase domain-containing protein [Anaeroselena agilis]|uniref:Glucosaminidase domain-containing protein n=1 Tax=Anaeroselena agilis TaxID=3063788 RepID=A0ABU3P2C2_9FIRM|nr:glucosaminidase domain-containing protein [Selenomonadales bacterium 4137-cl]
MPPARQLTCILGLALLLVCSPANASPERTGGAAQTASQTNGQSFYDRIMNILKQSPKPEPTPAQAAKAVKGHTPIFGQAEISKEQMVTFIRRHNPMPKINVALEELVNLYWEEAGHEGIRPDLALAQAILETGYFRFGGDVLPSQNNFAGIGTTGGGPRGATFESARLGVRAHVQHLLAYTTAREPLKPIIDPRYNLVRAIPRYFAQCPTWESLGGKWAIPGVGYGEKIVKIVAQIKGDGQ